MGLTATGPARSRSPCRLTAPERTPLGRAAPGCRRRIIPTPAFFGRNIQAPALPPGSEAYAGVVERYHAFLDASLERLQALGGETTFFVVCSVYGTHPSAPGEGPPSASHGEGAPGMLLLHGRDTQSTPVPLSMSTLDVAPTLLALLGVPVPKNMEGAVVAEALPPGLLERFPASRDGRAARDRAKTSVDADLEERMDALVAARLAEARGTAGGRP